MTTEHCLTSIDNNKAEVEYENLFNFLISNKREERTHTVECIQIHDNSKAYGDNQFGLHELYWYQNTLKVSDKKYFNF